MLMINSFFSSLKFIAALRQRTVSSEMSNPPNPTGNGSLSWFVESIHRNNVRTDVELYDELRRKGMPLSKRAKTRLKHLRLEEELALFDILRRKVQDKLVIHLRPYWLIYLPHTRPFRLMNISGTWVHHDNDTLLEGYRTGYEHFNEILRQYVAEKLSCVVPRNHDH